MRVAVALTVCVAVALSLLLASAVPATAANVAERFVPDPGQPPTDARTIVWIDDLESGAPGWTHGDDSDVPPKFHVDTYLAYDDPDHETDYSWWCGELNVGFAGGDGYGNDWDQWLEVPPVDLGIVAVEKTTWGAIKGMYRESSAPANPDTPGRSVTPVLTFTYRHDCEVGYDYAWVEVESEGDWVGLNGGWDGKSGGWQDLGPGGLSLAGYGDPVRIRFRFVSDYAWSDEDGNYISDGGAFHVDDICVHDAVTGEVFYWEDCEGGAGQSRPAGPPPAGDYWHLVDSPCQARSGRHAWSPCWPDSGRVPPNLRNWLMTPVIKIDWTCRVWFLYWIQFFLPVESGGGWEIWGTVDGGVTWDRISQWGGDQCEFGAGACEYLWERKPTVGIAGPGHNLVALKWVIITGEDGYDCSDSDCAQYCRAGIIIDDVRALAYTPPRSDGPSWGRIQALYEN
ncbi:MAG: hypothetical protein ABIG03_03600 [Candidatus Eisenbacteria bacterium]